MGCFNFLHGKGLYSLEAHGSHTNLLALRRVNRPQCGVNRSGNFNRKRPSMECWKCLVTFLIVLVAGSASAQSTIVSTISGGSGFATLDNYAVASGWSETAAYNNVTITALINGGGETITGTAYLMTQIGPGTTVADQVATANFSATSGGYPPASVTLFNGLTLQPGDYYLVLSDFGESGGGWEIAQFVATTTTAPGVSILNYYDTFPNSQNTAFPPDSQFSPLTSPYQNQLEYSVTGTLVVPEPSVIALFLLSLPLFVFRGTLRGN
jgi:hypothetical protein